MRKRSVALVLGDVADRRVEPVDEHLGLLRQRAAGRIPGGADRFDQADEGVEILPVLGALANTDETRRGKCESGCESQSCQSVFVRFSGE